jgi:carbonic anhydrase
MAANEQFTSRIDTGRLPQRGPGARAVVTCIDPRVNLEAIGISSFSPDGGQASEVRIVRTVGARIEERSLLIGMFLAGIREVTILTHTDCGCSLAHSMIDTIDQRMLETLDSDNVERFYSRAGNTADERRGWLRTFADPVQAAREEVDRVRGLDFCPPDLVIQGMVYDVATGTVELVSTQ